MAFAVLAVLMLGRLGGHPLQDPDEGRYAEIPREMIESGDWVTPRLNYVSYFEKPPLLYWMVAVSFGALGETEGAARLPPALAALLTVWLTYVLGTWTVGRRGALFGACVLSTSPLFFAFSQAVVIDMLLTAALTATLAAFYRAVRDPRKAAWALVAAFASATAVLAKGPVGLVLPGAVALAFLVWRRDWNTTRALLAWRPILLFCAVVVPWFALVSVRNPEFLHFFFVHEHLLRFTANVGHPEGPFFYVPVLGLGALPWTAIAAGLVFGREGRAGFARIPSDARMFLGLWAGLVLVFFTISSSKLAGYILPAFPPLALLAGSWFDQLFEGKAFLRALERTTAALLALGLANLAVSITGQILTAPIASGLGVDPADVRHIAIALGWSGAALVGVGIVRGALLRATAHLRSGIAFFTVTVSLALCLWAAVGGRWVTKTSRDLADAARPRLDAGAQLVSYRLMMQGLPFYTGHRVVQVEARGELWHGAEHSADEATFFWSDVGDLARAWSTRPLLITTANVHVDELRRTLDPPPEVLARDGNRCLLGRP